MCLPVYQNQNVFFGDLQYALEVTRAGFGNDPLMQSMPLVSLPRSNSGGRLWNKLF